MGLCHSHQNGASEANGKVKPDSPTRSPSRSSLQRAKDSIKNLSSPRISVPGGSEALAEILSFLKGVDLFKALPKEERERCAKAFMRAKYEPGATIIKQGEVGDVFFLIKSGEVNVFVEDEKTSSQKKVNKLRVGEHFGEAALLHDQPRNATIIAEGKVKVYTITRERFQQLDLNHKLNFPKRNAVGGANGIGMVATKPPSPKTPAQKDFIKNGILRNPNLSALITLDSAIVDLMVESVWREEIKAQDEIISEGDTHADYFYIVESGSFSVYHSPANSVDLAAPSISLSLPLRENSSPSESTTSQLFRQITPGSDPEVVATLQSGSSFGEVALLYNAPRNATVIANQDSAVWVLDRINFQQIMHRSHQERRKANAKYLDNVENMKCLLPDEKHALAQTFVERVFYKDDVLFTAGDTRNYMMILTSGKVCLKTPGQPDEERVAHGEIRLESPHAPKFKRKQTATTTCWACLCGAEKKQPRKEGRLALGPLFFGESALIADEEIAETVVVTSTDAHGLVLKRAAFDYLLRQPLSELREMQSRAWDRRSRRASSLVDLDTLHEGKPHVRSSSSGHIAMEDLKTIGLLGCGGFGWVELCEHGQSGETFALKQVSKGFIVQSGMKSCILREKQILRLCGDCAFTIKLYETYNCSQTLCFLMEAALGGELHQIYMRRGFYGSEEHARFYGSAVSLAFDHLHSLHVLYRDLKPENLLLSEHGQMKLTDMGLAKQVIGMTYTTCGTPDYFAPEVIKHTGQTEAVDWWCVGVLLFEFLVGRAPFKADAAMKTYKKILAGIGDMMWPRTLRKCPEALGLIEGLLQAEPTARLPMKQGGSQNFRQHKWYADFDWESMKSLRMKPPYVPKVASKRDYRQFHAREEHKPKMIEYTPDGSNWDASFTA